VRRIGESATAAILREREVLPGVCAVGLTSGVPLDSTRPVCVVPQHHHHTSYQKPLTLIANDSMLSADDKKQATELINQRIAVLRK